MTTYDRLSRLTGEYRDWVGSHRAVARCSNDEVINGIAQRTATGSYQPIGELAAVEGTEVTDAKRRTTRHSIEIAQQTGLLRRSRDWCS